MNQIPAALTVLYTNSLSQAFHPASKAMPPLGVIGYGVKAAPSYAAAPLLPAQAAAAFEIWTAPGNITQWRTGAVTGASADDYAFAVIEIAEKEAADLEEAVEHAYLQIFDSLERAGFAQPIRFWNYLAAITQNLDGMERYQRFNTGRQRAFQARLRQAVPPVASCLGACRPGSMIYVLAARAPALAIENPRQISAYDYPPAYGPTSPSFSRASRHRAGMADTLFVSGTASIVGHETRHPGDFEAQLAETLRNLRMVMDLAADGASQAGHWALKIYLRDRLMQARVEAALIAMLGPACQRLFLLAEICRADLLLEIEAVRCAGPPTRQNGF